MSKVNTLVVLFVTPLWMTSCMPRTKALDRQPDSNRSINTSSEAEATVQIAAKDSDNQNFVRIYATPRGRWRKGWPWELTIKSDGAAIVLVKVPRRHTTQQFTLNPSRLDKIREVLVAIDFMGLRPQIGKRVPDGTIRTIRIETTDQVKEVKLYYLQNIKDRMEREEARRFLDLWDVLRSTFEDPYAFDGRQYTRDFTP